VIKFEEKTYDYSIAELISKITNKTLVVHPEWQRNFVWGLKEKQLLIDSIIRGIPIPAVYFAKTISKKGIEYVYSVIDGQQRLRTIEDFINKGFSIKYEGLKTTWNNLPEEEIQRFLDYRIHVHLIPNPEKTDISLLFERLNKSSTRLRKMELWNCAYYDSELFRLLKEIENSSSNVLFKVVYSQNAIKRMDLRFDIADFVNCLMAQRVLKGNRIDKDVEGFIKSACNSINDIDKKNIKAKISMASGTVLGIFPDKQLQGTIFQDRFTFGCLFIAALLLTDKYYMLHKIHDLSYQLLMLELDMHEKDRSLIVGKITEKIKKYSIKLDDKRLFDDNIRIELWKRSDHICGICKEGIDSFDNSVVDHIMPHSQGGKTIIDNAQLAHKTCNFKKGSQSLQKIQGQLFS